MAQFETDDILNASTQGAMSTEFEPVPEGEWLATIDKLAARVVGADQDKPVLDVTWRIQDPAVAEQLGIENPTVRQTIFLDMSGKNLDLGKGKNIGLGRLREAVGQNGPEAWAPGMLMGCSAVVRVSHRAHEGRIYAEVKNVAAM